MEMSSNAPDTTNEPIIKYGRGQNPNSRKALRPAQNGEVRNPMGCTASGRANSRIRSLQDYLDQYLNLLVPLKMPNGELKESTIMEAIIMALVTKACRGDMKAVEMVLERRFGKEEEDLIIKHEQALKELK